MWAKAAVKKLERFLSSHVYNNNRDRCGQHADYEENEDEDAITHTIVVKKREERLTQFKELISGSIAACTVLNYCTVGTLTLPPSPNKPTEGATNQLVNHHSI
jgi:hypothetical protein